MLKDSSLSPGLFPDTQGDDVANPGLREPTNRGSAEGTVEWDQLQGAMTGKQQGRQHFLSKEGVGD